VANILVVEDDYLFRQTLEGILVQFDHTVSLAESADEAISLAQSQEFQLMISDVRIAGEVDGVEALNQIRKLQPEIRSIVMTGYSDIDAPVRAAGLQADDYLLKPFKMQALLQSVRTVLTFEPKSPHFLTRLGAVPGQAASRALRWFYDGHLQQLEELREKGLRQFFLLIRSKRLKMSEALAFFSAWEEIELDYLNHGSPQRWAQLVVEYHRWGKRLLELQVPDTVSASITLGAFELLYARIQSGFLELSHLLKSIQLLHFPEARKQNLEDFCTYYWVWGESSDQGDPFLGITVKGYRLVRLHSGGNSPARLYEAEAEYLPHKGDRILCLPTSKEWEPLYRREVQAERAKLLHTMHDHHFLFYSSYAMSLRSKLPGNGMPPYEAWKLLRPVFLQIVGFHHKGKVSGCFSLRDIDWPPNQDCYLSHFSDAGYRDAYAHLQKGDGPISEFFSAPEVLHQPAPTAASDQAVLGRLLFEVIYGGRYPEHSLRVHIRMLGKPESNKAFAPYLERLGPLTPLFYRLAHSDPEQRFPDVSSAITALDAAF
jgi:DNA-binding response OmpR family regulator